MEDIRELCNNLLEPFTPGQSIKNTQVGSITNIGNLVMSNQYLIGLIFQKIRLIMETLRDISTKLDRMSNTMDDLPKEKDWNEDMEKLTSQLERMKVTNIAGTSNTGENRPKFRWDQNVITDYSMFAFRGK